MIKVRMRVISASLAVALSLSALRAHADWLGDFYSSAGAGVAVTAPQAIASQNVVGYTGGGLSWRIPSKNLQVMQIQPPSLKMGCGGIDAYLGSYSFVNMDQFVQALRNFGQAAVGYFFELALRTMAPEIAATLDVINDLANRMNQFSMNSCAAAKAAVDPLGPIMAGMRTDSANNLRAMGEAVDNFTADFNVKTDFAAQLTNRYASTYKKPRSEVTKDDVGEFQPSLVNVLYWAIKNSDAGGTMSDEEIELVMSLVGPSLILGEKPSSDDPSQPAPSLSGWGPTIEFADLIHHSGSVISQLTCDTGGSDPECLKPYLKPVAFKDFSQRVREAVAQIKNNIATRTNNPLAAEHVVVLKLTTVPLHRAAAMSESVGVGGMVATGLLEDLIEYAAMDAATRLMLYYLSTTERSLATVAKDIPSNLAPQFALMVDRIKSLRENMRDVTQVFYAGKGDPMAKLDQLDKVERMMYSNLNTMLAANARFGKR